MYDAASSVLSLSVSGLSLLRCDLLCQMNFLLLHIVYKDLQSYKIHLDPQQTLSGTKQNTADIGENEIRFSREGGKKNPVRSKANDNVYI